MRVRRSLGKGRVWQGLRKWWWDRSCWKAQENTTNQLIAEIIREVLVQARHKTGAYLTRDTLIIHIKEQPGSSKRGPSQPLITRDTTRLMLRSANMTHYQSTALANLLDREVQSSTGREREYKTRIVQGPKSISNSSYKTDQQVKPWAERLNSAPNHKN